MATDESIPDEPPPDTAPVEQPATRAARTVPLGAFLVAVLVAVAMTLLAVVASTADDGATDAGASARRAAGSFAELLFTVDSSSIDTWRAEVLAEVLPSFREEFETSVDTNLPEDGASFATRAVVTDVFVGQVDDGQATAVVVYDLEVRRDGAIDELRDQYLRIELVRVDGRWLIEDVADLQFVRA